MTILTIENEALRVSVNPVYGARVVNLVDKHTGRDWMTQGGESSNTGEDTQYRSAEAVGWDECFPTVSPWDGAQTPWKRRLRDHGDLWGRPWKVDVEKPDTLAMSYADRQFRFWRELRLDGAAVVARYGVRNLTREPLPYLWALHALLAVEPGDRIEIPGLKEVSLSGMSLNGSRIEGGMLPWTGPNEMLPFALDEVQPRSTNYMGKFIARRLAGGTARVGRAGQWLEFDWDSTIDSAGIWLTYGGWPQAAGGHQEIAIEPQSADADHLGQAIDRGALPLAPSETREWRVTLTVKR